MSIGKRSEPPETVGGRVASGRTIVQRLVSSDEPSNSSERRLFCGHSSLAVARIWSVVVPLPPSGSVTVSVALYVPGFAYV